MLWKKRIIIIINCYDNRKKPLKRNLEKIEKKIFPEISPSVNIPGIRSDIKRMSLSHHVSPRLKQKKRRKKEENAIKTGNNKINPWPHCLGIKMF